MRLMRLKHTEYWVCIFGAVLGGLFSLALKHGEQLPFMTTENAPILMRMSFPPEKPTERSAMVISELKNTLSGFDDIREVKIFIGQTESEGSDIAHIYNSEVLLELLPDEQRSSFMDKNRLITKLNELAAYAYPGIDLKLIQDATRPSVLVKDAYTTTQMKFIPNQDLLNQMNIDEYELNKQLSAYIRLAPQLISMENIQNFGFVLISERQSIPFGALGEFKVEGVEHKQKDLSPGYWKPMTNEMNSAIIIEISIAYMNAYGLGPLSKAEIKIKEGLESLGQEADAESVGQILMLKSNGNEVMLKDIARIEIGYLDVDEPYSITWQER